MNPETNYLRTIQRDLKRASVHASNPRLSTSIQYAADVLANAIKAEEDRLADEQASEREDQDLGNPLHAGSRHKSFPVIVEGKVQP